jgi:hypothetical protein
VIDMPASYPSLIKTWTNKQDNIDDVFAGDINGAYDEIKAIETELMQVGYKRSVRAATTQDGALATAYANGQTIDGIVLTTGDRILIKDQTNGADNGIYTINASGAPTRATDANSANHMVAGLMVYVREGTINAKGTWKLTTTGAITLGTTPLTFENEVMAHLADDVQVTNEGQTAPPHGLPKCKYDATAAPTADNDTSEGYSVGSKWIDIVNSKAYECLDATEGAAVWQENGVGEVTQADVNALKSVINSARPAMQYKNATQVNIRGLRSVTFLGFRFQGQYAKKSGKTADFSSYPVVADFDLHMGAQSLVDKSSWYAIFAVLSGGVPVLKIMPYLRVKSVAGSVITIGEGGENGTVANTKAYSFTDNNLAGADCLVCHETLDARANAISGRITSIAANTVNTITLDNVGAINTGDYILPAPPGFPDYVYLGTVYMDTAELRNIADTGSIINTRGSEVTGFNINGDISAGVFVSAMGHISPLATAVEGHFDLITTASAGDLYTSLATDSGNHEIWSYYFHKAGTAAQSYSIPFPMKAFSFYQKLFVDGSGTLNVAGITRKFHVRGWFEQ